MKISDIFYSVATGPKHLRSVLTPIGLLLFLGFLLLVVFGSLYMDSKLSLPKLLPSPLGTIIGVNLLLIGLLIWAVCVVWFTKAKGTPVPFNPPRVLISSGPYAWSRNPMLTGVFVFLFGLGFFLHSVSMVLVWTPIFIVLSIIELKWVEEPELERRFGDSYREYKQLVPMFVPRVTGTHRS
jgi:protein-S-isoprenylcysteine O-methyltransferase Ste14